MPTVQLISWSFGKLSHIHLACRGWLVCTWSLWLLHVLSAHNLGYLCGPLPSPTVPSWPFPKSTPYNWSADVPPVNQWRDSASVALKMMLRQFCAQLLRQSPDNPAYTIGVLSAVENKIKKNTRYQKKVAWVEQTRTMQWKHSFAHY